MERKETCLALSCIYLFPHIYIYIFTYIQSLIHSHSFPCILFWRTPSHTHTHTRTYTHTLSLSHTHTHTHTHSLTHSITQSLTHTLSLSLSLARSLALSRCFCRTARSKELLAPQLMFDRGCTCGGLWILSAHVESIT